MERVKIPYGNGKVPLFFQTAAWDTYLPKLVHAAVLHITCYPFPKGISLKS